MGSLSIWHWLIVLLVVVLIFGTKKLRNMGGDVGGAVKEFKNAMNDGNATVSSTSTPQALVTAEVVKVPTKPKVAAKKSTAKSKVATAKPATAKAKAPAKTAAKVSATKATVAKTTTKKPAVAKPKAATKVAVK